MNHQFVKARSFLSQANQPVFLFKNIWKDKTTVLLHGPREIDKAQFALSIAEQIGRKGREVLYVNTNDGLEGLKCESDNVYVFTPEFESIDDKSDYADLVFDGIEHAVRTTNIRTFVIDSVNRIAALSFGRNASAAYVMKRLVALQVRCKLSLLVLADHTTKSTNNALTALADTHMCMSFEPAQQPQASQQSQPSSPERFTTTAKVRNMVEDREMARSMTNGLSGGEVGFPVSRPA